jgi:hypothetical protein
MKLVLVKIGGVVGKALFGRCWGNRETCLGLAQNQTRSATMCLLLCMSTLQRAGSGQNNFFNSAMIV